MRKLATVLLLSALPLTASAAVFDGWKDAGGPGKNTLPFMYSDTLPTNYVYDTGFTATTDVQLGFGLKFNDLKGDWVVLGAGNGTYPSFGKLELVYFDGGAKKTELIFEESRWSDNVTYNYFTQSIIGPPSNLNAFTGPTINLAAGTDFYFVLTVNGVEYNSSVTLFDYFGGEFAFMGQEASMIGFDVKGNGTFDNYIFTMSYAPNSVGLAPIPEPETYAMMLAGLALVGAVARRRKLS
ncbi:MAG: FxDxF family PEP-CTERM protein [Betaproteobacteria bacterium]|nr:FxDxF family PEP-CTERM protein [Betaproteobacteria bacterium]